MEKNQELNPDAYKQMLEALPVGLFFTDADAEIKVWNKAITKQLGVYAADVTGQTLDQAGLTAEICGHKFPSNECVLLEYLQSIDTNVSNCEKQTFCLHIAGATETSDFACQLIYAEDGSLQGVLGIATELQNQEHSHHCLKSETFEPSSALEEDTFNVLNTSAFYDALNRDWHRYQRYQNIFSILSLEIDYYPHFEAVLGENAASDLITHVISNIGSSLRRSDIIGQVAANRFIILLSNSDRKSALKVANMLLDNLHQQTCPDLPLVMSASIGAVSVEDKQSLDKTLERADNALHRSVEMGRNQVTFWG
ncbi:MAG: diguanylate cyclase [Desulfuromonadaceae bacterium]